MLQCYQATSVAVKYGPVRDAIQQSWQKFKVCSPEFWKCTLEASQKADLSWWTSNVGRHVAHHHGATSKQLSVLVVILKGGLVHFADTLQVAKRVSGRMVPCSGKDDSAGVWKAFTELMLAEICAPDNDLSSVRAVADVMETLNSKLAALKKADFPKGYAMSSYHLLWLKRSLLMAPNKAHEPHTVLSCGGPC